MIESIIIASYLTALGVEVPQCEGRLFRAVGRIVCIEDKNSRGLPESPRRSSRDSVYIRQKAERTQVRKPVIRPPVNKPFAVKRYTRRTKRSVIRDVEHVNGSYDRDSEIARIRNAQIQYHQRRLNK